MLVLALAITTVGCGAGSSSPGGGGNPSPASITSLNPTSGFAGTSVTISGANFGATQGTSTVKFNGTAATPTSWSATSIVVPVPAGATTGNVVVTVGGVASNGVSFTVTAPGPSITNLNPTPLLATPPTVTTTLPVVAPAGTGTTMLVALQLVGVAAVPLNFTVLVPCVAPKFAPLIVTDVPANPDVGFRLVMFGDGTVTVKLAPLLATPPTVTTT